MEQANEFLDSLHMHAVLFDKVCRNITKMTCTSHLEKVEEDYRHLAHFFTTEHEAFDTVLFKEIERWLKLQRVGVLQSVRLNRPYPKVEQIVYCIMFEEWLNIGCTIPLDEAPDFFCFNEAWSNYVSWCFRDDD